MKRSMIHVPAAIVASLLLAAGASAKVPAAEADKLGKSLTCVGAEKAGSASGVPEYVGKWLGVPPGMKYTPHVGQHPVDPYAGEKPLFTISSENLAQYAERLTDGQKAMFAKYPKTYRIVVYPGHRDFRYPDSMCTVAKKNALESEMNADGLGVKAFKGAVAFPIPKSGNEALFNMLLPFRAFNEHTIRDTANVLSSGSVAFGRAENKSMDHTNKPEDIGKPLEGVMAQTLNVIMLPEREKGTVSVSSEPVNFGVSKRLAWSYDPGTRRVRQVPLFGFDNPMPGTGGKMTTDADRFFNGSPERYNWKLVGKREVFVPANTFALHANTVKYADLLKPGHANPDLIRYELRRVWVVEGSLKEGFRHLFGKRVLFLDEDTWHAVLTDLYDARQQLWQHAVAGYYYTPDTQAWHSGNSFFYDMNSGGYVAYNLFQERPIGPLLNKGNLTPDMFTPDAARAAGN